METYEEKYKDLVKRLNKAREEKGVYTFNSVLDAVAPELKIEESENERIRRKLIAFLKQCKDVYGDGFKQFGLDIEDILAWLEKKSEQKPIFRVGDTIKKKSTGDIVSISEIDLKNREYRLSNTGFIPFKYEYLWELIEQKPKWNEEDVKIINSIRSIIEKYAFTQSAVDVNGDLCEKEYVDLDIWLKGLKDRIQPQPEQGWSEEDEAIRKDLMKMIPQNMTARGYNRLYNWLKTLKDRVQPQPNVEWTEEDEDARNHLLGFLNGFSYSETAKHEMWDWLKQLRAKPYWKPSDEQIAWCNIAKDCVGDTGREYLKSLYNDLKKLKE